MLNAIHTEISESVLQFAPETGPLSFGITIHNHSPQFASFRVELVAAGADPTQQNWYRLSPSVSAKIPPGDQTQFQAHLLAVPPIPGGFTGTMNLTVRVYSTELRSEDRKDIRLIITGAGLLLPKISLPKAQFKARPQELVDIRAILYNPNRKSLEVQLELTGLDPTWLPEGTQKSLTLLPAEEKELSFSCRLPTAIHAPRGIYPCGLKLLEPATSSPPQPLQLEILSQGFVTFECDPLEQWIPEKTGRWLNPFDDVANYTLSFNNQSNVKIVGQVTVVDLAAAKRGRRSPNRPRLRLPFSPPPPPPPEIPEADEPAALPTGVTLAPTAAIAAPGETDTLDLAIQRRLPWVGWSRLRRYQLQSQLADGGLDLRNDIQTVELNILPIIPLWLQLLGGTVGLVLLGLIWGLLTQQSHTQPVHTVQFNGTGTEVVSGASDQTLRRWQVGRGRLRPRGIIDRGDKAVRVVTYRPVNNDWVVAGLENGAIQIHSLLSPRASVLEENRDDRVFDLAFSQNARTLWSAHGSGVVLRWELSPDLGTVAGTTPAQTIETNFATSALALGGETRSLLALGGRYQQLALVDLVAEEAFDVAYPRAGNQTAYINSLDTAEEHPNLLAVGASDGFVSLWDLERCLETAGNCRPIDEWLAHGGNAVRSVAFSPDGCALISSGDDGQVQLWSLTGAGERRPDNAEGRRLHQGALPVNAVDVRQQARQLLIVSGGDDTTVRLHRVRWRPSDQCRVN